MKIVLTELIVHQMKTVGVMFCAGVILESLWMIRSFMMNKTEGLKKAAKWPRKLMIEGLFWMAAAIVIPTFLYYCSYGKVTWYGIIGFLIGLLLWKKICCGIIK